MQVPVTKVNLVDLLAYGSSPFGIISVISNVHVRGRRNSVFKYSKCEVLVIYRYMDQGGKQGTWRAPQGAGKATGRRVCQDSPAFLPVRSGPIMVWPPALRIFRLHGQSGTATIPRRRASGSPRQSEPNLEERGIIRASFLVPHHPGCRPRVGVRGKHSRLSKNSPAAVIAPKTTVWGTVSGGRAGGVSALLGVASAPDLGVRT